MARNLLLGLILSCNRTTDLLYFVTCMPLMPPYAPYAVDLSHMLYASLLNFFVPNQYSSFLA